MMHGSPEVEFSSGNLWADIGRPDADEALARATLMSRTVNIIRERGLSVAGTAEVLKLDRSLAADLMRGKMSRFALERLIAFLNALDRDVEITVRQRPPESNRAARFVVTRD